jgi:hypothetical protein
MAIPKTDDRVLEEGKFSMWYFESKYIPIIKQNYKTFDLGEFSTIGMDVFAGYEHKVTGEKFKIVKFAMSNSISVDKLT